MEDSSAQASWYARESMFSDSIKTPEEKLLELDKVSNEQIKKIAKKIFKENQMRVAIIGDVKENSIKF